MQPRDVEEVWESLDLDLLRGIAHQGPAPVFAAISGAHLYGFPSPDSDVDLRGAFLLPAADLLGLSPSEETVSIADDSTIDLDWVAHDVRKFARLMTNHNGYVMEQLYSPLVVLTTPEHEELRELGRGCLTRPTVRHYLGFARGRVKRLGEPNPTVKHLLYAYRVYLTGIHLMEEGEVVSHAPTLNEKYRVDGLDDLIARKKAGKEKTALEVGELDRNLRQLETLEADLHAAHAASELPEEPTTREALGDFVVRIRLEAAG